MCICDFFLFVVFFNPRLELTVSACFLESVRVSHINSGSAARRNSHAAPVCPPPGPERMRSRWVKHELSEHQS